VGFVVDDAIVMLENIVRHMELGEERRTAAFKGSREVGFTILSMTISLVAVFIPILFMGGLLGRLFFEFAMTITVAICISGFVSLTLTPMLCSRFLIPPDPHRHGVFYRSLEWFFEQLLAFYAVFLRLALRFRVWVFVGSLLLVAATAKAIMIVPKGFIPRVDTGQLMANTQAIQDISFDAMKAHQKSVSDIVAQDPNVRIFMSAVGARGTMNQGMMFVSLKPEGKGPGTRQLSADAIIQEMRKRFNRLPGIQVFLQNPPSIPIGGHSTKGLYQYSIQGIDTKTLYPASYELLNAIKDVPGVQDMNSDLLSAALSLHLEIDREKASLLGLTARQVDMALSEAYATHQVGQIYTDSDEFQLLMEVQPKFYKEPNMLGHLYLSGSGGRMVPLSAIAHFSTTVQPLQINHVGQLPSVTMSFNLAPGASLGTVEDQIQATAERTLPSGISGSFNGSALAFQSSLKNMLALAVVAILFIYIVLGILYESFTHPITILAGLPSAGLGAVMTLYLFHMDLDIYGFLGIILLIGIVKKNAIMMIDRALDTERERHLPPEEAIYEACLVRFRPIMMTTMAALFGSLPLALGTGAGSEARRPLGMAIVGGLLVSQLVTLFITPVYYIYVDRFTEWLSRKPREARLPRRRWT
ncbi:MAG TPA: efflux RND transporter permease subunit, partial [Candidatus Xenobia bacterium]